MSRPQRSRRSNRTTRAIETNARFPGLMENVEVLWTYKGSLIWWQAEVIDISPRKQGESGQDATLRYVKKGNFKEMNYIVKFEAPSGNVKRLHHIDPPLDTLSPWKFPCESCPDKELYRFHLENPSKYPKAIVKKEEEPSNGTGSSQLSTPLSDVVVQSKATAEPDHVTLKERVAKRLSKLEDAAEIRPTKKPSIQTTTSSLPHVDEKAHHASTSEADIGSASHNQGSQHVPFTIGTMSKSSPRNEPYVPLSFRFIVIIIFSKDFDQDSDDHRSYFRFSKRIHT